MLGNRLIICPYKGKCTGYPLKCRRCRHNRGRKDYFEPIYPDPPKVRTWQTS